MEYKGIELELAGGKPSLTHSVAMDMIRGESSTQNMDWTSILGQLPWGQLKEDYFDSFDHACRIFSLLKMDYQVCNGGIEQYFYNRYNEPREPHSENDVELYGIEDQKRDFLELVSFAKELFPERVKDNDALAAAAQAFQKLSFEENAQVTETIYCDEDEYLFDPETGTETKNPDYYEPYEETVYEDVICGGEGFNELFYEASDYMDELLELQAQFHGKRFAQEFENHAQEHPELASIVRGIIPAPAESAQTKDVLKPSLSDQIKAATSRGMESSPMSEHHEKASTPER